MAENESNPVNGNNNEPPLDSSEMQHAKRAIESLTSAEMERLIPFLNQEIARKREQEEFERLRIENDEEFQLWLRKYDAIDTRRARERRERTGDWKYSWNKTISVTENDSKCEEQQQVEDEEEASDALFDFEEIAREAERKKARQKQVEDMMYRCYLDEKKNPWKFSRTMSGDTMKIGLVSKDLFV